MRPDLAMLVADSRQQMEATRRLIQILRLSREEDARMCEYTRRAIQVAMLALHAAPATPPVER
jgi:hypothetical protein